MARRDQLTYDLGQRKGPHIPWKSMLLLSAVIAVGALLLVWVLASSRAPQATRVTAPVSAPSVSPAQPDTKTATPLPSGSDAAEGLAVPEGSRQAASVFVRAWLDREPQRRKSALAQVATPGLAEQLMLTDPANVPRARPRGAPVLDGASTYSTQFTQTLTAGMKIQIYLVADPGSRYGWLATSVDQA